MLLFPIFLKCGYRCETSCMLQFCALLWKGDFYFVCWCGHGRDQSPIGMQIKLNLSYYECYADSVLTGPGHWLVLCLAWMKTQKWSIVWLSSSCCKFPFFLIYNICSSFNEIVKFRYCWLVCLIVYSSCYQGKLSSGYQHVFLSLRLRVHNVGVK
jgi:hypothetical protein